jgi:GDP-4-dehydro-6-deoxy-D-mannose reductase
MALATGRSAIGPGRPFPSALERVTRLRVLITGYGGFAGGHLAEHLLAATDWELYGTAYIPEELVGRESWPVRAEVVDLRDPAAARQLVDSVAPDLIFHLAGQAFVPDAWVDAWGTFETNVRMQLNVLEAVAAWQADGGRPVRVVAVTSREVYGNPPAECLPVNEVAPLAPHNPYATSKAAQDLLAAQYVRSHRLDVVRLRPFNHIGPRQDSRFVASGFARQVAEIETGRREPVLRVGDLSPERDFTDVRDMVRAYRLAAERGQTGDVYNLGSGQAHAIGGILDFFVARAQRPLRVEVDADRFRPTDAARTLCDAGKAQRELGWRPEIAFEQTLADILADWRDRVGTGATMVDQVVSPAGTEP